jgi:hypothetical protein
MNISPSPQPSPEGRWGRVVIEREDLPVVVINLLTKNRTELAVRTIHQCLRNLKYEGKLLWYISDNGSESGHVQKLLDTIPHGLMLAGIVRTGDIGECWNAGLRGIFTQSDYYIRLEDDMCLKAELDITRYVKVMMTNPKKIGMVRLGQMVIDLEFISEKFRIDTHIGYEEELFLMVQKTMPYCFSGHPALIHKRFHDAYGYFPEAQKAQISAGELEIAMDFSVRNNSGPAVFVPWDLGRFGTWGARDHVGTTKAK